MFLSKDDLRCMVLGRGWNLFLVGMWKLDKYRDFNNSGRFMMYKGGYSGVKEGLRSKYNRKVDF